MMAEEVDEDAVSGQVLQQLSQTAYACSSVSQLSSRPGNFVYRGVLAQPFPAEEEVTVKTIIIKHSVNSAATNFPTDTGHRAYEPVKFEESLLNSVAHFSPHTSTAIVIKTPRLYLLDRESNTQVLEDFVNTNGLKSTLLSPDAGNLLPPSSLATIGWFLGSWLWSFHRWAVAPQQATLRAQIWQNDSMRKIKYLFTYDGFLKVLETYPELLEGHRETFTQIRDTMAKEYKKPSTEEDEDWGLIHGDFWSGNILLPATPWQEPPLSSEPNKLFIIDWEFAQFGHRSTDIGQIIGDLYERKIYSNSDTAITVMEGVINGYGELSDQMSFRIAIYVGVHLIGWYNRRPRKGPRVVPPDVILAGLTIGRDFIIKGWEKDRKFFESSALALLFNKA